MDTRRVLLHICCAPCATGAAERLIESGVDVTLFFYNPNLEPRDEHDLRAEEAETLAAETGTTLLVDRDGAKAWKTLVAPFADEAEGGRRCRLCFGHRLEKTARRAQREGFDGFATSLTISPHKNVTDLLDAGQEAGEAAGAVFLPEVFRKADGYRRSTELAKSYGLYRQDYCGCAYSLRDRRERQEDR